MIYFFSDFFLELRIFCLFLFVFFGVISDAFLQSQVSSLENNGSRVQTEIDLGWFPSRLLPSFSTEKADTFTAKDRLQARVCFPVSLDRRSIDALITIILRDS